MNDPKSFTDTGIFTGVPFAEYAQWPGWNKSVLWKIIKRTPAHAKYARDHESVSNAEMLLGSATNDAILMPEEFAAKYVVQPATYTADRGKDKGKEKPWNNNALVCKQWREEVERRGQVVVSKAQFRAACDMRDKVRSHPYAAAILDGAEFEVSVQWRDEHTGLLCKGRWDIWNNPVLADLKTCRCAAAVPFGKAGYNFGYHLQATMYLAAARALVDKDISQFIFIAVENEDSYEVKLHELDPEAEAVGIAHYRYALDVVAQCEKSGEWPGYAEKPDGLVLPPWAGTETPDANVPWQSGDDDGEE